MKKTCFKCGGGATHRFLWWGDKRSSGDGREEWFRRRPAPCAGYVCSGCWPRVEQTLTRNGMRVRQLTALPSARARRMPEVCVN